MEKKIRGVKLLCVGLYEENKRCEIIKCECYGIISILFKRMSRF